MGCFEVGSLRTPCPKWRYMLTVCQTLTGSTVKAFSCAIVNLAVLKHIYQLKWAYDLFKYVSYPVNWVKQIFSATLFCVFT